MVAFIDTHRDVYGVEPLTRLLPIASSTYHEHARQAREPQRGPARQMRDAELSRTILRVHTENFGAYGRRKVWRQMLRERTLVARCTVARLMRHMGLKGVVRGKGVKTTVPDKAVACPLDKVQRQFRAPAPNRLWLSDLVLLRVEPAPWRGQCQVATWNGYATKAAWAFMSRPPMF